MTALFALLLAAAAPCLANDPGCAPPSAPVLPAAAYPMWIFDQLRFPTPKDLSLFKMLESDHSMDAVMAHLSKLGIVFERSQAMLRHDQTPADMIALIGKLPPGEPLIMAGDNGQITVNVLVEVRSGPPRGERH